MPPAPFGPLDPQDLSKTATALVSGALLGQARALVVARQQDATAYLEDPTLMLRTRQSQEELGRDVDYYLNRLMPDVIGRLADATSAAGLVTALGTTLGGDTGRQSAPQLFDALVTEFTRRRTGSADLADALSAAAQRTGARATVLEAALQERIDALRGDDGEIQKTKDAITATRDAINQDLNDLVKAADEIGSGVKNWLLDKVKIVTGILSSFGGSDGEDGGADTSAGGDAPAGGDAKKPGKKFDVSGLDVDVDRSGDDGTGGTSQGSAELGSSAAAFREHNDELAGLYRLLARQKAELAVAAAIRDQAAGFAESVQSASAAATALGDAWQSVLDAALSLQAETDDADTFADLLAGAVSSSAARWSALTEQLGYARAALAGRRGQIPDVGPLPTDA